MNTLQIPAFRLQNLISVASMLEEAATPVGDADQLSLFGEDQAIDAFMEEREELRERIAYLEEELDMARGQIRQELDSSRVYTGGLRSQIETLTEQLVDVSNGFHRSNEDNAILTENLVKVGQFANTLQAALNTAGIYYGADPATGEPRIAFNVVQLDAFVRERINAS